MSCAGSARFNLNEIKSWCVFLRYDSLSLVLIKQKIWIGKISYPDFIVKIIKMYYHSEELNIVKSSHTTFYTFTIQVRTHLSKTSSKR